MKSIKASQRLGALPADRIRNSSAYDYFNGNPDIVNRETPYRIALYSHDTMGLGHIKRNILIAKSLLKSHINCSILLISGSRQSSKFDLPFNAEIITLPSIHKNGSGNYSAKNMDIITDDLINIRSNVIKSALKSFNPDVLIVDKVARGALKELDASLKYLKRYTRTICVLGLRDILDDPQVVRKEWGKNRFKKTIEKYYKYIWIYGDKKIYDVAKEYGLSKNVDQKIVYTGYLVKDKPFKNFVDKRRTSSNIELPDGKFVLCVLGGGQDGYEISKIFLKIRFPENTFGVLLTGPFMDSKERMEISELAKHYPHIFIYNFVPDPADLLNRADRVIAMGGYNTICELIYYRKKSLIIPRVTPRREQLIRAECLSEMGLVDYLHPDNLSPESVSNWLRNNVITHPILKESIDLNGIIRIPALLMRIIKSAEDTKNDKKISHGIYHVR